MCTPPPSLINVLFRMMEKKDSDWVLHIPDTLYACIQYAIFAELIFRIICLISDCKK